MQGTSRIRPDRQDLPQSVLFVVPRFHTNLAVAVRTLVGAGCRVHVFAPIEGTVEDHSAVVPRIFPNKTSPREIRSALKEAAPDLVFIRSCKPLSRTVGYYCRLRGIRAFSYGLAPVFSQPALGRRLARFRDGQPLRRVSPVRGLDPSGPRDRLAEHMPWPVEAANGLGSMPDPHFGPLRILCVGKLGQPRKNQDKLIAALDAIDRPDEIELTLVGSTSDAVSGSDRAHLQALLDRAEPVGGRFPVTIQSDVPYARMPEIYARHHVCVLPADREPLGIAPLEAMAYGLVPVFSRACGSAGNILSGQDGFIVDAHDPASMQDVFARLLADRDLVERVGRAARNTAVTSLGPDAFLARLANLYTR